MQVQETSYTGLTNQPFSDTRSNCLLKPEKRTKKTTTVLLSSASVIGSSIAEDLVENKELSSRVWVAFSVGEPQREVHLYSMKKKWNVLQIHSCRGNQATEFNVCFGRREVYSPVWSACIWFPRWAILESCFQKMYSNMRLINTAKNHLQCLSKKMLAIYDHWGCLGTNITRNTGVSGWNRLCRIWKNGGSFITKGFRWICFEQYSWWLVVQPKTAGIGLWDTFWIDLVMRRQTGQPSVPVELILLSPDDFMFFPSLTCSMMVLLRTSRTSVRSAINFFWSLMRSTCSLMSRMKVCTFEHCTLSKTNSATRKTKSILIVFCSNIIC